MEFEKRCALGFVALSIAFPLLAEAMKANGAAMPGNPAWILVSTIRNVFVGSWVLLLALTLVHAFLRLRQAHKEAISAIEAQRRADEQRAKNEIESTKRWIESETQRLKGLEESLRRKEELRVEFWNEKWRELEVKKSRTPEEATEVALQDFG